MTPSQKGAFCKSCQKEVLDLTSVAPEKIPESIPTQGACIRVQQEKLDELNFFEWFTHLTLRKQLKYLFLFSLVFVNTVIASAQTHIDYKPTVQLDSIDQQTFLEVIEEDTFYESSVESEEEGLEPLLKCTLPTTISWIGPSVMGDYMLPIAMGFLTTPMEPEPYSYRAPLKDSIKFGKHHYVFKADKSVLSIAIDARYDHEVLLTISRDLKGPKVYPVKNSIFTIPLLVRKGQHLHEIPINSFFVGSYTIRIEGKQASAVTRIMHW